MKKMFMLFVLLFLVGCNDEEVKNFEFANEIQQIIVIGPGTNAESNKKEIEIAPAFEDSIVANRSDEGNVAEKCINAKSLFLRCVNFPLYPMLGSSQASKIAKILATLP